MSFRMTLWEFLNSSCLSRHQRAEGLLDNGGQVCGGRSSPYIDCVQIDSLFVVLVNEACKSRYHAINLLYNSSPFGTSHTLLHIPSQALHSRSIPDTFGVPALGH